MVRVCGPSVTDIDGSALASGRRVGGADLRLLVRPDLGTGLGGWDLVLRKLAHAAEYAVLGALLLRATGRIGVALALGVAYAVSDEIHQTFVPGRAGKPLDVAIDTLGVVVGIVLWQLYRSRRRPA